MSKSWANRSEFMRRTGLSLLLLLVGATCLRATSVRALSWEELVDGADFVGVVRCVIAGGIVAEYEVEEGWKGGERGDRLRIREPPNHCGPVLPLTLVGDRFLVAAPRAGALWLNGSAHRFPLWWRDLRPDFELPLFQGKLPIRFREKPKFRGGGWLGGEEEALREHRSRLVGVREHNARLRGQLEDLRERVQVLEGTDPVARELGFLRGALELLGPSSGNLMSPVRGHRASLPAWVSPLFREDVGEGTFGKLVALLAEAGESRFERLFRALLRGGGHRTLEAVERSLLGSSGSPALSEPGRDRLEELRGRLRARLEEESEDAAPEASSGPGPALDTGDMGLSRAELLLAGNPLAMSEFFVGYCPTDVRNTDLARAAARAGPVFARTLQGRLHGIQSGLAPDPRHALASLFAWRARGNRRLYLRWLLEAEEPWVRVTGAVYLSAGWPEEGLPRLRELVELPGEPGRWAALELARRGEGRWVEELLELFRSGGREPFAQEDRLRVRERLAALFSNAASHSGVASPPIWTSGSYLRMGSAVSGASREDGTEVLRDWWEEVRDRIRMEDPWLSELTLRGID